ncbi:hypothetical protein FRC01_001634 [Tulasnella sp. 417]|nr:hypothetical protein FRC01_001634 [Tulasnella sp. 417]
MSCSEPLIDYDRPGSVVNVQSGRNGPFDLGGNIPGTPTPPKTSSTLSESADVIQGMSFTSANLSRHPASVGPAGSMEQTLSSSMGHSLSPVAPFNSYGQTPQHITSPIRSTTPQFLSPADPSTQTGPPPHVLPQQPFEAYAYAVLPTGQLDMRLAASNLNESTRQYPSGLDWVDPNDPPGIFLGTANRHQGITSSHGGHGTFLQPHSANPLAPTPNLKLLLELSTPAPTSDVRHSSKSPHPRDLPTVNTSKSGPPSPYSMSPIRVHNAGRTEQSAGNDRLTSMTSRTESMLQDLLVELPGELIKPSQPLLQGGFANVYRGTWIKPNGDSVLVAIKVLRAVIPTSITVDQEKLTKKILRIYQAALGLAHLHHQKPPICHGDVKPENVLINDSLEAVLSDFGVGRVVEDFALRTGLTTTEGGPQGTCIYAAPEMFNPGLLGPDVEETKPSCEGDVYAFAGLILTVRHERSASISQDKKQEQNNNAHLPE